MNNLYYWILVLHSCVLSVTGYGARTDVRRATAGGNVTLPVTSGGIGGIFEVIWIRAGGNHFATVTPDGKVRILNDRYEGRLHSSSDLSLTITHVTAEDQGPCTATVFLSNGDSDEHNYYVIVTAEGTDLYRRPEEAPPPDPCSVSLEGSCNTGGNGVWIIPAVTLSVLALIVILLLLLYLYLTRVGDRHIPEKKKRTLGVPVEMAATHVPYQTKLMQDSEDRTIEAMEVSNNKPFTWMCINRPSCVRAVTEESVQDQNTSYKGKNVKYSESRDIFLEPMM